MEQVRALVAVPALIIMGLLAWVTRNEENDWMSDYAQIRELYEDSTLRTWTDGTD